MPAFFRFELSGFLAPLAVRPELRGAAGELLGVSASGMLRTGVAVAYSPEYRYLRPDLPSLEELCGGRAAGGWTAGSRPPSWPGPRSVRWVRSGRWSWRPSAANRPPTRLHITERPLHAKRRARDDMRKQESSEDQSEAP